MANFALNNIYAHNPMTFDTLPNDPIILLGFINTRLRDYYGTLNELCDDLGVNATEIKANLATVGYVYDPKLNKFI